MNILSQLTALQINVREVLRFETAVNAFTKEFSITVYYKGMNGKALATQVAYSTFEDLDRNASVLYNSIHNQVINQRSKNES